MAAQPCPQSFEVPAKAAGVYGGCAESPVLADRGDPCVLGTVADRALDRGKDYLREAFEWAVEDLVLAGVITRRSDDVHTKQLRNINYTEGIWDLVDRGMSENSPWVHDRSRRPSFGARFPRPSTRWPSAAKSRRARGACAATLPVRQAVDR